MTQIPDVSYPTQWRVIDTIKRYDVRQMSLDTWQIRSPTHIVTVDSNGFKIFRENDKEKWDAYLDENKIEPDPRPDLPSWDGPIK